jgi:hypothetical protein
MISTAHHKSGKTNACREMEAPFIAYADRLMGLPIAIVEKQGDVPDMCRHFKQREHDHGR